MAIQADSRAVYTRTKTRVPALGAEVIRRPRLLAMLEQSGGATVTLVQAPAGYGKTSLLQQWGAQLTASGAVVAWFTPDPNDQDAEVFLSYLVHALEEAGHVVGESIRSIVATESLYSWRLLATQLANSFVGAAAPCYLFLDDTQHLKSSEALECLQHLLDAAPPELRFVIASREDPGIPLGRLRALGRCFEVRPEHLRFDSSETAHYLKQSGHAALSADQLATLEARTEGWIVGLKLLGMALRWKPQEEIGALTVSGEERQIADFFAEDVIARQPQDVQQFLLRTSVLDRLCPALCDSLPGVQNSRTLIDQCDASGLFLVSLDQTRTWYRYHQLFADFLRRQLKDRIPGLADELRVAASRWLEQAGFHIEAFEYALRGNDPIRAAGILDAQCDAMWSEGRQETIQALAARLPAHVQALFPRIMLAIAWRLTAQWRVDQAKNLVAVSRARLTEEERSSPDTPFVHSLRRRVLHRESQVAHYLYQLENVEKLSRQLIAEGTDVDDPYTTASVYITLQYAEREQFELGDLQRLIEKARQEMDRTGFSHGLIFVAAMAGPSYFETGRTSEAIDLLNNGLRLARNLAGPASPLGAVTALHLAYVLYECNEIAAASALMEEYGPCADVGIVDQLVSGFITQCRLQRLRGDSDAALGTLHEALTFADKHNIPRLRAFAAAEHVRMLLRLSRPNEAARAARSSNLAGSLEQTTSRRRQTAADSTMALAWCKLAGAEDRVTEALAVARRWRAHVTTAGAAHAAAEWNIALAELLMLAGDRKAAQRTLTQAITHAAPSRFVRIFLDEGEPVGTLLEQMSRSDARSQGAHDTFVRELLGARGPAATKPSGMPPETADAGIVSGRLNTRELEILVLAGSGMLNKQISEKLGLTEGTVKWYLQQVFDKLGVRDRARAAAKARQLGLIG